MQQKKEGYSLNSEYKILGKDWSRAFSEIPRELLYLAKYVKSNRITEDKACKLVKISKKKFFEGYGNIIQEALESGQPEPIHHHN